MDNPEDSTVAAKGQASVDVLEASALILCKADPTCPKCRHIFLHKALILKQLKVKGFVLKGFN